MRNLTPLLFILAIGCGSAVGNDCTNPRGDVDGDGVAAPRDASLALDIALGIRTPRACEWNAADWDGDGLVERADADSILAHWVKTP
jgi:hypothetical protein